MMEKVKEIFVCFYEKKRYSYEDKLGLKKIAIVPQQQR
jgi:hypothetical protein